MNLHRLEVSRQHNLIVRRLEFAGIRERFIRSPADWGKTRPPAGTGWLLSSLSTPGIARNRSCHPANEDRKFFRRVGILRSSRDLEDQ